ncbi:MAG: acyl-CoA dehydrogenase family protein [Alphaproteobacteria bacterium]|nr:acyl-CoA dehydrogenase [Rhizobiaceae bacterium]MBU3960379.1 acyl-CoA dehydrogenase family protein [Alphaproteobacteria bacterium]MBU4051818.1 acyl-CoA dehydrogenase family protein [Alphaproteobacteria bacterium]MBU4090130.1 acyl-CoA dehydrogenase family protein [Alphaproteobacteria bacterium]MBU4157358.1 acyl-CoA dehydrogenase family protein [Alphaproteobacteria bacterium]
MSVFARQAERTAQLLQITPGWKRLQQLHPDCDDETTRAILDEAASFAEGVLHPLNTIGDRQGCTVSESRVRTPAGFADAYRQYAQAGWLGMDVPETFGGQSLPLTVQAACSPLFERGCVALMMAAGSSRAASHLLARAADAETAAEWVPRLTAGDWAATICISEPEAGSDVGRLRTRAELSNGEWRISGQKIWISFGDHDMTERIGHCLLARTGEAPGTRGLSLFLVPNRIDGEPNGITLERIEEKMGLHGSPTCALRFDGARGSLIGEPGRGLPELFAMIELMRLLTACQGLGIASASADIAEAYAAERRQGGPPDAPPVPIAAHPDVRRQLQEIRARTEVLRAAVLELATIMDLARLEPDPQLRSQLSDLAGWMLPLIKNFGAGAGFDVANAAIQVLGGAGYTKDWPLEQYLRDSRVMTIYEGTTGMQALDFLTRRLWREEGRGLRLFQARARQEIGDLAARHPDKAEEALRTLDTFDAFSTRLMALQPDPDTALYQAHAYMTAAWAAVTAWMMLRLQQPAAGLSLA